MHGNKVEKEVLRGRWVEIKKKKLRMTLLVQVSSFRLPLEHSGSILTLSNAACSSLPSPHLLVVGTGICIASPLG